MLQPINVQKTHSQFTDLQNLSVSKSDSQVRSTLASKSSDADAPWYQPIADFFYSCWSTLKYYLTCGCMNYEDKRPVEEQAKDFFKSEEHMQKIFIIGSQKIGILFNPKEEKLLRGNFTIEAPVTVVSDKEISEDVQKKIRALIPSQYKYSILTFGKVNGQSTFEMFGFE